MPTHRAGGGQTSDPAGLCRFGGGSILYNLTTIESGPLVRVIRCPAQRNKGPGRRIGDSRDPTPDWMQRLNDRRCWESLSLWLHAYHSLDDLFVTLSYGDEDLPPNYNAAKKKLVAFLRKYREECHRWNLLHSYIYVLEGEHGDHRIHHHLVVYAGAQQEILRALWTYGGIHIETIREFGQTPQERGSPGLRLSEYVRHDGPELGAARFEHDCFVKLAKYMTKEPRKTGRIRPGGRAYTPSRDRYRPQLRTVETEDGRPLEIPEGCIELEHERISNAFMMCERQTLWRKNRIS